MQSLSTFFKTSRRSIRKSHKKALIAQEKSSKATLAAQQEANKAILAKLNEQLEITKEHTQEVAALKEDYTKEIANLKTEIKRRDTADPHRFALAKELPSLLARFEALKKKTGAIPAKELYSLEQEAFRCLRDHCPNYRYFQSVYPLVEGYRANLELLSEDVRKRCEDRLEKLHEVIEMMALSVNA